MFTVLDQVSVPGFADYPNEDICGTAGDFAWVIDTSIFPGTAPVMHPQSDAAWFAAFCHGRLVELAPAASDGPALVRQIMDEARQAFWASAPAARRDPVTWPRGALTLVQGRPDRLKIWTFADTTAYVRLLDGQARTVGEAPALREFEAAKARELLAASGCTPATVTGSPAFRAWLAERRERQKRGGGAAVLSLDPSAADRMQVKEVPAGAGTTILLTSDGLSALVDLYERYRADTFLTAAVQRGLAALAEEARRVETEEDPLGIRYPRFKTSDDATGLLLEQGME